MAAEATYLNLLCAGGRIASKAFSEWSIKFIEEPRNEELWFLVLKILVIVQKWSIHHFTLYFLETYDKLLILSCKLLSYFLVNIGYIWVWYGDHPERVCLKAGMHDLVSSSTESIVFAIKGIILMSRKGIREHHWKGTSFLTCKCEWVFTFWLRVYVCSSSTPKHHCNNIPKHEISYISKVSNFI